MAATRPGWPERLEALLASALEGPPPALAEALRRLVDDMQAALPLEARAAAERNAGEDRRKNEARWRLAAAGARIFRFEHDPRSGRTTRSAEADGILGLDASPERAPARDRLQAEDHARHAAMCARLTAADSGYTTFYRAVRPDTGTTLLLEERGLGLFDAGGRLQWLVGLTTDVTARRDSRTLLQKVRRQREEALGLLAAVFEAAPLGLGFWDREMRLAQLNPALAAIAGRKADALRNLGPHEVLPGWGSRPDLDSAWRRILDTGAPLLDLELRGETPQAPGEVRHWAQNWFPVHAGGGIIGVAATVMDITDRKRAEEALEESRTDLERAQAIGLIGSWRLDVGRNELRWSAQNHRIFGLPPGTPLTYETFLGMVHPEDRDFVHAQWTAALAGAPYDIEHRIVVHDQVKWVRERAELELDAGGTLRGGFGTTQDITARKHAEELIHSAALFPEENPYPVLRAAADGTLLYANRAAGDLLAHWGCRLGDRVPETIREPAGSALASSRRREIELHFDGRDLLLEFVPILQRRYVNFYGHDITARNRAEQNLRESRAQLETIVENMAEGLVVADLEGQLIHWNRAALEMHGFTSLEECRRRLPEFAATFRMSTLDGRVLSVEEWPISRILAGETLRELDLRLERLQGDWRRIYRYGGTLVRDAAGHPMLAVLTITDITASKQAELALRDRENELRLIMDTAPALISYIDADFRYCRVNRSYETWFNARAEDLQGRQVREVLGEEAWKAVQPFMERALAGETVTYERELPYRAGGPRWVQVTYTPDLDAAGRARGMVVHVVDIADRRRAEAEILDLNATLEERVRTRTAELQAANAELEAFCYSVSHDLRAPLRAIDGFSLALLEDCGDHLDPAGQDHLRRVRGACQRMGQLIDDLLELSRLTRGEMQRIPVDLTALARQTAADLQAAEPWRDVEFRIAEGLVARGDPRLILAAIWNLLGNAWKFSSRRSRAVIEVGASPGPGPAVFFVRDNGVGFDMQYIDKVFDPFQRLHGTEFPGSGIGLAVVQRVVHRHGGRLWAESAEDHGATFYFALEPPDAENGD
jgi:PAS domain S-box-containing protein